MPAPDRTEHLFVAARARPAGVWTARLHRILRPGRPHALRSVLGGDDDTATAPPARRIEDYPWPPAASPDVSPQSSPRPRSWRSPCCCWPVPRRRSRKARGPRARPSTPGMRSSRGMRRSPAPAHAPLAARRFTPICGRRRVTPSTPSYASGRMARQRRLPQPRPPRPPLRRSRAVKTEPKRSRLALDRTRATTGRRRHARARTQPSQATGRASPAAPPPRAKLRPPANRHAKTAAPRCRLRTAHSLVTTARTRPAKTARRRCSPKTARPFSARWDRAPPPVPACPAAKTAALRWSKPTGRRHVPTAQRPPARMARA